MAAKRSGSEWLMQTYQIDQHSSGIQTKSQMYMYVCIYVCMYVCRYMYMYNCRKSAAVGKGGDAPGQELRHSPKSCHWPTSRKCWLELAGFHRCYSQDFLLDWHGIFSVKHLGWHLLGILAKVVLICERKNVDL